MKTLAIALLASFMSLGALTANTHIDCQFYSWEKLDGEYRIRYEKKHEVSIVLQDSRNLKFYPNDDMYSVFLSKKSIQSSYTKEDNEIIWDFYLDNEKDPRWRHVLDKLTNQLTITYQFIPSELKFTYKDDWRRTYNCSRKRDLFD